MTPLSIHVSIHELQYQSQENGWGLLSLQLCGAAEALTIAGQYHLSLENNTLNLSLFQLPKNPNRPVQFVVNHNFWQTFCGEHALATVAKKCQLTHQPAKQDIKIVPSQNQLLLGVDNLNIAGSAPLFAVAKQLQAHPANTAVALLAAEHGFAFRIKPARYMLPLTSPEAIGACSLLEDWSIANRLATLNETVGALEGTMIDLLQSWLHSESTTVSADEIWQVRLFWANKKGQQQLLTFTDLKSKSAFTQVIDYLSNL